LTALAAATGGVIAVEFGLIAAFLILPLTVGLYDFATGLYTWMEVGNAARAGAEYVNVNGYSYSPTGSGGYDTSANACASGATQGSAAGFTCAVQGATNLGTAVTVKAGPTSCGCQFGTSYNLLFTCVPGQTCAACNSCGASYSTNCCPAGQTPVTTGTITATYNFQPLFNYLGLGPTKGYPISATSTVMTNN